MQYVTVFGLGQDALKSVVDQIADDQWSQEIPPSLRVLNSHRTLRDAIHHMAYDDAWVPDVLAGRTMEEVGNKFDGDLLGADPRAAYARIAEAATAAVAEFSDFDRTVHLMYGDHPAHVYLLHITIFRGLQAYDLARFVGVEPKWTPDLVRGLWDLIEPQAEELREFGAFGRAIAVPADAPLRDRLLGLTGRDPAAT